ncbi:hypothetical protein LTS10_006506 [Elasticomyces elasticus]|nr:hypothetical protein LTS10_006506 [Elasticomyces elasticus]
MSPGVADHVQQVNRFWTHQLDRGPQTLFNFPEDEACLDDTEQLTNINQLHLRGRWWFSNTPATARTWSGNPAIVLYVARTNPRTARHSTSSTKRMAEMMITQPPWCVAFESSAGLEGTLAIVPTALTQADGIAVEQEPGSAKPHQGKSEEAQCCASYDRQATGHLWAREPALGPARAGGDADRKLPKLALRDAPRGLEWLSPGLRAVKSTLVALSSPLCILYSAYSPPTLASSHAQAKPAEVRDLRIDSQRLFHIGSGANLFPAVRIAGSKS